MPRWRQRVRLEQEMERLECYVEIQKMRFAERLEVTTEVPRDLMAAQVPSLLL